MYGGYPPPQHLPPSPDELLASARRAGVMMIVLGVLSVACGLCLAFMGGMMDSPEMLQSPQYQQLQQQFQQIERETGLTLQRFFVVMGIVPLAIGAILGALGFFVRGGGKVAVMGSIVLVSILLVGLALVILGGIIQALTIGGGPEFMIGICVYIIPLGLLLLLLVWLIQAARASSRVELARQQYQMQMWQYEQYQQAYLQQNLQQQGTVPPPTGMGYGYPPAQQPAAPPGAAPSTPPSSASPPPTDPFAERKDPSDGASPQG
jgi:hypothetical protein